MTSSCRLNACRPVHQFTTSCEEVEPVDGCGTFPALSGAWGRKSKRRTRGVETLKPESGLLHAFPSGCAPLSISLSLMGLLGIRVRLDKSRK